MIRRVRRDSGATTVIRHVNAVKGTVIRGQGYVGVHQEQLEQTVRIAVPKVLSAWTVRRNALTAKTETNVTQSQDSAFVLRPTPAGSVALHVPRITMVLIARKSASAKTVVTVIRGQESADACQDGLAMTVPKSVPPAGMDSTAHSIVNVSMQILVDIMMVNAAAMLAGLGQDVLEAVPRVPTVTTV